MRWRVRATFVPTPWLLLLFFHNAQGAAASENLPPLLSLSKELECATNSSIAEELLESYEGINLPGRALPNEWFGTTNSPSLHAQSLDIALHALSSTSKRFPELAADVEKIILQWNYCDSLLDNTFYDLTTGADKLERKIAFSNSSNWEGFHAIGFLGNHHKRFVFDTFKFNDKPYVFYEVDYSTYFRKQCLPHPVNSELYFSTQTYFPWRIAHVSYRFSANYPYRWKTGCNADGKSEQMALADSLQNGERDSTVALQAATTAATMDAESEAAEMTLGPKVSRITGASVQSKTVNTTDSAQLSAVSEEASDTLKVDETSELANVVIAVEPAQLAQLEQVPKPKESIQAEITADPAQLAEMVKVEEAAAAVKVDHASEPVKAVIAVEPPQVVEVIDILLPTKPKENADHTLDSMTVASESIAEDVAGKSKAVDTARTAQSLEIPVLASLEADERERAKVPRLSMYSFELPGLRKSTSVGPEELGFYHYKDTLRPEKSADGIAEYAFAQAPMTTAIRISVDYTDDKQRKPVVRNLNSPSVPSVPPNVLVTADSFLGRRWISEKYWRSAGNGYRKVTENAASVDSGTGTPNKNHQKRDEDAVTHFPVVIEEDNEAPVIVVEQPPTPELSSNKEIKAEKKQKKKQYYGLSGSLTLSNKSFDSDGFSITAGATYKPIKDSYYFVRSSWNYRFSDEEFRYTWGIGYDDWHPGTFAFQLNHWGPLLPGDYLDFDNAIASATYKFNKSELMEKHKLSSSITLSQKISGDPVFSWSNSWSPVGKWFVRSTISQPIKGGETGWSYGFGYANYAPFTFSFEYNNWGFNKAFEDNFKENGALSLTYRWRF